MVAPEADGCDIDIVPVMTWWKIIQVTVFVNEPQHPTDGEEEICS